MSWLFSKKINVEELINSPITYGSFSYYIKKLDGEKFHTVVKFNDDVDFWRELMDSTVVIDFGFQTSSTMNSHKIRWNASNNPVISERISEYMEALKKVKDELNERQVKLGISREEFFHKYLR